MWIKRRVQEYGFIEGQDFVTVPKIVQGATQTDYAISLDMAKEIAMVEKNEKGRAARQYFIEVEKKSKAASSPIADTLPIDEHIKRPVQIESSKIINGHLVNGWGATTAIEYNRQNCKIVTGFYPSELIALAKKRGMKSKQYASGKEVVRNLKPAWAAQMSINDRLVKGGMKLNEANSLSTPCVPLLEKMIELNLLSA